MTWLLTFAAFVMAVVVMLVSSVQLLYLEALRIRTRDLPSLQFFKESIEPRIALETERGVLAFSLVKHIGLGILGCLIVAIATLGSAALWEALLGSILIMSLFTILGAHLIPQIIYRKTRGEGLMRLVPVMRVVAWMVSPLTWSMEFLRSLFDLDGKQPVEAPPGAEEHIEALINAGEEQGIIEKGDRQLIQSAVAFGDKTVREVLTPRPRIVAMSQDATLEELRQLVITEQYSRIPAYDGDIDNITGFVHVRDLFELSEEERLKRKVRDLLRPIRAVPETKPVNDLLREMQEEGAHMAVVVDEYGFTAGIVTMEDMVEELVGEIHDEHEPERDFHAEPDGSFVLSGSFDLDRMRELLDFHPEHDTESTTIGGLVTEWLGRVPAVGEEIERDGIVIQVLAANNLRVDQVRVAKAAPK
jgi:putative hemolysin